jgi:hypothetical protein
VPGIELGPPDREDRRKITGQNTINKIRKRGREEKEQEIIGRKRRKE